MATHSSVLSWRIPGTGGAWWAAVYGVAQSRTQLKRLSSNSSSRPFRYDQNQIPYDYTVDVTNRFKGLDLIDRVPDELWMETGIKTSPRKKMQKSKMAVRGGLTNNCEKKRSEKQRRKGKIDPSECRNPKKARRDKKAFLSDECKEIEETIEWERLEISSRKLEIPSKHFMQRCAQ